VRSPITTNEPALRRAVALARVGLLYALEPVLIRVPFDGGTPTTLAANVWVQDLDVTPWGAIGDGYVYFADGATRGLSRVPAAGGEQKTIAPTPISSLSGIGVLGNSLV
jgi:hypothetical protein